MEERIRHALRDLFDSDVAERATLDNLGGHASLRIYWRVHLPADAEVDYPRDETSQMAMVLPEGEDILGSEEGGSSSDPEPEELPFSNVQRYLDRLGLPVPEIDYQNMEIGVLLLEDLGDTMFEDVYHEAEADEREGLYREAVELLVEVQRTLRETDDRDCVCWEKEFDRELLRWELDHYREWGLEAQYREESIDDVQDDLDAIFDRMVDELLELPQALSLRDYQSRNIMRKNADWFIIDFQDALKGPFVYDLVALLRDSYIELEPEMVEKLVAHYVVTGEEAGLPWCEDLESVRRAFHLQTLQRKLKDAGRFIYIDRVKLNPGFLEYYEPSIGYVKYAVSQLPEYEDLARILAEVERKW